jgi:tetratricopeptide (TPR) repeat protein
LGQQAVIALESGDREEAIERWDEAIRLCSARDVETRARLLWYLAEVRRKEGHFEAAAQLHDAAAEHFARCGDSEGEGEAKLGLALVDHDRGLIAQAELRLDEAEPLFAAAGTRSGLATAAGLRGALAHLKGDLEGAVRHYRHAADIQESLGSPQAVGSLVKLGGVHALRRDFGGLEQALHRIETAASTTARGPWEGHLATARLALLAYRRDWTLWATQIATVEEALQRAASISDEFGAFARVAGDLAQAAGMPRQAQQAYQVADSPARSKGEMSAFTIVDGMLSRLPKLS